MRRSAVRSGTSTLLVLIAVASLVTIPVTSGATPVSRTGTRFNLAKKIRTTSLATAAVSPSGATVSVPDDLALAVARRERPHSQKVTAYNAPATPPAATDLPVSPSGGLSWRGLNEFDNRYSGGGQYSSEPSDLGMCTSGSYVMELVNSSLQVYGSTGTPLLNGRYQDTVRKYKGPKAVDLNSFFGFPPAVDRSKRGGVVWGPSLYDISCLYDDATSRWFAVAALLEVEPVSGDFTGENSVLIAVSSSANPVSSNWSIFQFDTSNDGLGSDGSPDGSPDHDCADNGMEAEQCFGDYPQVGIDDNGFYVTTNEFEWWGSQFNGAQVYAFSKADLVAGVESPRMLLYSGDYDGDTNADGTKGISSSAFDDEEAYTLQPVNALSSERAVDTMYFGSSLSWYYGTATEAFSLYTLEHTEELLEDAPDSDVMLLSETLVETGTGYGLPPKAQQKAGSTPTLSLYNAGYFGRFPKISSPIPLDTGSGKFYGAWLDNGSVFLTTATEASGTGGASIGNFGTWKAVSRRSAVALFVVDVSSGTPASTVTDVEIVGVLGQNLSYPSVAVNSDGDGAIGATLAGPAHWPSAVYLDFQVDGSGEVILGTSIQIARAGVGPNDGYTGWYPYYWRSRWGDYGATGVDASGAIWMAAGYIAQTCTLSQYQADPTCNFTRDAYANWGTAIFRYAP